MQLTLTLLLSVLPLGCSGFGGFAVPGPDAVLQIRYPLRDEAIAAGQSVNLVADVITCYRRANDFTATVMVDDELVSERLVDDDSGLFIEPLGIAGEGWLAPGPRQLYLHIRGTFGLGCNARQGDPFEIAQSVWFTVEAPQSEDDTASADPSDSGDPGGDDDTGASKDTGDTDTGAADAGEDSGG